MKKKGKKSNAAKHLFPNGLMKLGPCDYFAWFLKHFILSVYARFMSTLFTQAFILYKLLSADDV